MNSKTRWVREKSWDQKDRAENRIGKEGFDWEAKDFSEGYSKSEIRTKWVEEILVNENID